MNSEDDRRWRTCKQAVSHDPAVHHQLRKYRTLPQLVLEPWSSEGWHWIQVTQLTGGSADEPGVKARLVISDADVCLTKALHYFLAS